MKLLWVVPRYGPDIVGGAERFVRALALRGCPPEWSVEVATTCAVDHAEWANALPEGESTDGRVVVRRFEVGPRDAALHSLRHRSILDGRATYADELEWLASGVWSPGLQRHLADTAADYDLRVFAPYLFGTTLWGAQVVPDRTAIIPCLHDEPYARLRTVGRVLRAVRGCIFNSAGEASLANRLLGVGPGPVVGKGFDDPGDPAADRDFRQELGIGGYILYTGRLEQGKGVDIAVQYAIRHARERRDAPPLVLIGRGSYRPPRSAGDAVRVVGYVDEVTKRAAYRGAVALFNPSGLESLSIVLLECWLEGTPALVNAGSDVMVDHCARSGCRGPGRRLRRLPRGRG